MLRSVSKLLAPFRALAVPRRSHFFLQCLFGVLVALIAGSASVGAGLDLSNLSLLFLLITVLFAARFGFWQATFVAIAGFLYFNALSGHSVFTRAIATPRNGITLFLFEVIAFVVSRAAMKEREHAVQVEIQRHRTQRLHAVSHNVLLLNLQDTPERQIAEFIQQEFELDAVAIVTGAPASVGAAGQWREDGVFSEELGTLTSERQEMLGISSRPLLSAKGAVGSLLILGDVPPLILDSLASLAALALERHRASVNQGLADAARKTEELRTTVLDGLAHAFKTPLTIIRAASSGLLEAGKLDEMQRPLIEMIDEQSERLDELTTRLLKTARVESEDMCLQIEIVDLEALIKEVVREFREEAADCGGGFTDLPPIHISIDGTLSPVSADYEMLASTLKELLNNALKYSTAGSSIVIGLEDRGSELTLSVQSHGELIRNEDVDRIFERFCRGPNHRHTAPGTGIGLSVARRVAEAHGGQIWVTSGEEEGTTFYLSLPACSEPLASARGQ